MGTVKITNCTEYKEYLLAVKENPDLDLFFNHFRFKTGENVMMLPKCQSEHDKDFGRYDGLYGKEISNFKILQREINGIVGRNWNKKFMHIFFITESKDSMVLKLIFRFSDVEEFLQNKYDLDFNFERSGERVETAYELLPNGTFIELTNISKSLQELSDNYKDGEVGNFLKSKSTDFVITDYITYKILDILDFNGFEHDLNFELVAPLDKNDNTKIRLGLDVKVNDNDRVHHIVQSTSGGIQNIMEGYYDLGDLKP